MFVARNIFFNFKYKINKERKNNTQTTMTLMTCVLKNIVEEEMHMTTGNRLNSILPNINLNGNIQISLDFWMKYSLSSAFSNGK